LLTLEGVPDRYHREAALALAVHHEHRDKDLTAARRHARRALGLERLPLVRRALERRVHRLDEKLAGLRDREVAVSRLME
jgi:hypothetical protein